MEDSVNGKHYFKLDLVKTNIQVFASLWLFLTVVNVVPKTISPFYSTIIFYFHNSNFSCFQPSWATLNFISNFIHFWLEYSPPETSTPPYPKHCVPRSPGEAGAPGTRTNLGCREGQKRWLQRGAGGALTAVQPLLQPVSFTSSLSTSF